MLQVQYGEKSEDLGAVELYNAGELQHDDGKTSSPSLPHLLSLSISPSSSLPLLFPLFHSSLALMSGVDIVLQSFLCMR